jgi:hypothetical protein
MQSQAQSTRPAPGTGTEDPVVKIYPNPATSYITFDLQKGYDKGLTIQIYSFLGKKMYESPGLSIKQTVDLSDFNRGIYMYHLVDATGKVVKSGKFQVSK